MMERRMDDITSEVLGLPIGEKRKLMDAVMESIEKEELRLSTTERYGYLVKQVEAVTGYVYRSDSRHHEDVVCRIFVANRMAKEGYSHGEIGRAMHRNHSTVTYMIHKFDDWNSIPTMYADELKQYDEFEKLIDDGRQS